MFELTKCDLCAEFAKVDRDALIYSLRVLYDKLWLEVGELKEKFRFKLDPAEWDDQVSKFTCHGFRSLHRAADELGKCAELLHVLVESKKNERETVWLDERNEDGK